MAYPAILRMTTSDGQQDAFTDPEKAEVFISNMAADLGPQDEDHRITRKRVIAQIPEMPEVMSYLLFTSVKKG